MGGQWSDVHKSLLRSLKRTFIQTHHTRDNVASKENKLKPVKIGLFAFPLPPKAPHNKITRDMGISKGESRECGAEMKSYACWPWRHRPQPRCPSASPGWGCELEGCAKNKEVPFMFTLHGTFRKQCIVHSSICTKVRKKNKIHPQNTNTSTPTITHASWLCTVGHLPFVLVLEYLRTSIKLHNILPKYASFNIFDGCGHFS